MLEYAFVLVLSFRYSHYNQYLLLLAFYIFRFCMKFIVDNCVYHAGLLAHSYFLAGNVCYYSWNVDNWLFILFVYVVFWIVTVLCR